jgi:hypothetical protein
MIAATLIYFPPDWPRRIFNWPRVDTGEAVSESTEIRTSHRLLVSAAVFIFLAVQVLVPLRHHLYPGNVSWTEEGHRFSWHMKLRNKESKFRFAATAPSTGEHWIIDPRTYLTQRQVQKMSTRPDMLLQFCHHVADRHQREGKGDIEVRARVLTSLNNRERQLLIDPEIDLAKVERNLRHADWIVPLTTPLKSE